MKTSTDCCGTQHGHVLVTHLLHRDQILILMTIGFCFVGYAVTPPNTQDSKR